MSLMQAAQTRSRGGASRDRVASSNRNCSDQNPEPSRRVNTWPRYAIIPLTEVSDQAAALRCRPDFDTARVSRTASRITAF